MFAAEGAATVWILRKLTLFTLIATLISDFFTLATEGYYSQMSISKHELAIRYTGCCCCCHGYSITWQAVRMTVQQTSQIKLSVSKTCFNPSNIQVAGMPSCWLVNSPTTQVSQYQKGKTNLGFTEARDSEWQRHQRGHMQVCTLL